MAVPQAVSVWHTLCESSQRRICACASLCRAVKFYKWPLDNVDTPSLEHRDEHEAWNVHYSIERNASGHVESLFSHLLNATVIERADVSPFLPIHEQMRFKYLLCLEGNSMATAIMWMLASDSVVLMPPPTQEGWALEGRLKAWVHYVPLSSPDELDNVLSWLRKHDATRARAIIRNANRFVRHLFRRDPLNCPEPSADGDGPAELAWQWHELRDGSQDDARNMRRVLHCLVDPAIARALIRHAADSLSALHTAHDGVRKELLISARRAARRLPPSVAEQKLFEQYATVGPVEGLGRRLSSPRLHTFGGALDSF